jgi:hypothetical protein
MRKTLLRRLEALEKEHRSREQQELFSLRRARWYIWVIVFAYYLGGLQSDEHRDKDDGDENIADEGEYDDMGSPWKEYAKALKYPSLDAYFEAVFKSDPEIPRRVYDAYCRLFAKVGLDLASAPSDVLFEAFVPMVDQLPDHWLNWLRSNLRKRCRDAEIAAGSNLPRRLTGDSLFRWVAKR